MHLYRQGALMSTKKLFLFRHGQTDWNLERRCQGHTDIPLNAKGINQARELAKKLEGHPLEVVYSSDLSRALETAELALEGRDIPIVPTERLRETHMGEAEGLTVEEAIRRFGEATWNSFRANNKEALKLGFPGGETRGEALTRLRGLFDELVYKTDYQTIGLSTHGGALRSLIHSFLEEGAEPIAIPNCVVYELSVQMKDGLVEVRGPY